MICGTWPFVNRAAEQNLDGAQHYDDYDRNQSDGAAHGGRLAIAFGAG
jgi:hypothetical protein